MDTHTDARPFVLVAALDLVDTDSGGYALDQSLRVATRIPGCEMHVLHVSEQPATPQTLGLLRYYVTEKAQMLPGFSLAGIRVHVRVGEPAHVIAELAAEVHADLVVVGTHRALQLHAVTKGHTGERVTRESTCPVLVAGPRPKSEPPHIIVIEGTCPECLVARQSSAGQTWWCARHAERHPVLHHHLYGYATELPFAEPDAEVIPTGVD